jgi:hypothetical protein
MGHAKLEEETVARKRQLGFLAHMGAWSECQTSPDRAE